MIDVKTMTTEDLQSMLQSAKKNNLLPLGQMITVELRRRTPLQYKCRRCSWTGDRNQAAHSRLHGAVCPMCFGDVEVNHDSD